MELLWFVVGWFIGSISTGVSIFRWLKSKGLYYENGKVRVK